MDIGQLPHGSIDRRTLLDSGGAELVESRRHPSPGANLPILVAYRFPLRGARMAAHACARAGRAESAVASTETHRRLTLPAVAGM
jgi:hypothetical protein